MLRICRERERERERVRARLGLGLLRPFDHTARVMDRVMVGPGPRTLDLCGIEEGNLLNAYKVGRPNDSPCLACRRQVRIRLGLGFLGLRAWSEPGARQRWRQPKWSGPG